MHNEAIKSKALKEKPHYSGHRKRLRERFLKLEGQDFPDYELLEMILFPAKPMGDVKPMAKALLDTFGSFGKVLKADSIDLQKVEGVGESAVAALKVVTESVQRLLREELGERSVIQSWDQLLDYCRLQLGHLKHEEFHVLFLNHRLELIVDECQQKGTVNHAPVYPREVVKRALELGASSIILVHNHPSGDIKPSRSDLDMTEKVIRAAQPLSIDVHDHVVIGGNKHFSFRSKGLI